MKSFGLVDFFEVVVWSGGGVVALEVLACLTLGKWSCLLEVASKNVVSTKCGN